MGIDPGTKGGVAVVSETGAVLGLVPLGPDPADVVEALRKAFALGSVEAIVLEHVWSSPGWGHAGAFTFGKVFGAICGVLLAHRREYALVLPRTWQGAYKLKPAPEATKTEKKNGTKALALDLFPEASVTHATADALLLAEYCRRQWTGGRATTKPPRGKHGKKAEG